MDYQTIFLIATITFTYIYVITRWNSRKTARLPPGPYRFPIVGSLFKLGNRPHHDFASLSLTYGPLMSLKLGNATVVVVSSPEVARDFFQKHDQSFTGRPVPELCRIFDHYHFSFTFSDVGGKWRRLRKMSRELLFSVQNLDASRDLRGEKVRELAGHAGRLAARGEPVDLGVAAFTTSLNVLSNFVFSRNLAELDSRDSQEFKDAVWEVMELIATTNLADYFPVLKRFDVQGLWRDGVVVFGKLKTIFDRIIDERVEKRAGPGRREESSVNKDVLDMLLDIEQKTEDFGRDDIFHLLFDLFAAGTDTTSATLEWAMSELIRNPQTLAKARIEMHEVFGKDNDNVHETDFMKLPYLQAIVKETFRLHPPAPFLVPHKSVEDVEVKGFVVPKDAQILCNVWAMGRDPAVWASPDVFMPERFLDVKIDFRGHDFELIPFGAGRRMCPGMALADRILHLMLGSLIYKFDWKLERGMRGEDLDMSEKFGLTVQRVMPLRVIPVKV